MKIGDNVSLVDSIEKGKIIKISGLRAEVEFEDGFIENILIYKLVLNSKLDLSGGLTEDKHIKTHIIQRDFKTNEIDLHIENLDVHWRKLKTNKILERQISCFWEEFHLSKVSYDKLIVIHGKGKGILKARILEEMNRYPKLPIKDLDYGKYRGAALEISFIN